MSEFGIDAFDKTIQLTHVWLKDIGERIGEDKQRQYHALRAVLFALRDRMTTDEAFHLSAQMPMLVRGIFWEGYKPAHKPDAYRSKEEFLDAISKGFEVSPPLNPEESARAVFATISRQVQPGEVDEVRQMLPEPVRDLFPS